MTETETPRLAKVEDLVAGDRIDQGVFAAIDPRGPGQGPNTVNVRLADGTHYTETAGATVRVWEDVFVCGCGNMADDDGFAFCLPDGTIVDEPTVDSGWDGHYRCNVCGAVVVIELSAS